MGDETIKIGLDPAQALEALKEMSKGTKELAAIIDEALGKNAVKSFTKFEDAAENGTNRVTKFFSNLSKRVTEDLKTAFDLGRVMEGVKFGNAINDGIKQVFDMEKAFGRLNSRLKLTNDNFLLFKKSIGRAAAGTGQKLEDILPGVETTTSKTGIKDIASLTAISKSLGEIRATTNEDTGNLADQAIEIMKAQGMAMSATTMKATLDALQATRVQGAFRTATEAGQAIHEISKSGAPMGLDTRQMGGLAAMASKGGESGLNILSKLMEQSRELGGGTRLNQTLGQNIFKTNEFGQSVGMDISKLSKVNMQNPKLMELMTGLTGSNGQEIALFFKAVHEGQGDLKAVIEGSNEVGTQFEAASKNMGFMIDKFKESTKNAASEIGGEISNIGYDIIKGNFKNLLGDTAHLGESMYKNAGTVALGLGVSAVVGSMTKGGLKGLLGGAPGLAEGITKGTALKEVGISPVYVTNAKEIGKDSNNIPLAETGLSLINVAKVAATASVVVGTSAALTKVVYDRGTERNLKKIPEGETKDKLREAFSLSSLISAAFATPFKDKENSPQTNTVPTEAITKGVHDGMIRAYSAVNKDRPKVLTNPSKYPDQGRGY